MNEVDRSQFLGLFKTEALEHLRELNNGLIELEKNPLNLELFQKLNREAHTIKGAARMMGFEEIQAEAHQIEDLFALAQEKKESLKKEEIDGLFAKLDLIEKMVQEICQLKEEKEKNSEEQKEKQETPSLKNNVCPIDEDLAQYLKIPLDRIDQIMNLTGEIVISKVKDDYKVGLTKKISKKLLPLERSMASLSEKDNNLHSLNLTLLKIKEEFAELSELLTTESIHMDATVGELSEAVSKMRMLPASTIFDTYPRMVRDLSQAQKKELLFKMVGKETEIDKKVIEEINPALMHILRNAIDHGIESSGEITLKSWHEGNSLMIEISDNGAGIDLEAVKETALHKNLISPEEMANLSPDEILNFIFAPGFSTSKIITDVSGRGVGLDVVKTQIEKMRGQIKVFSKKGEGTRMLMKLPLTVAILDSLMVKLSSQKFALPLLNIDEVLEVKREELNTLEGVLALILREHLVPLINLKDVLGVGGNSSKMKEPESLSVLIVNSFAKRVGFVVDEIIGEEKIHLKALPLSLGEVLNVEGAAILGNGEVVVVLDVNSLIKNSKKRVGGKASLNENKVVQPLKKKILVVEDSLTTRELEKSILEKEGYKVVTAIDGVEGLEKVRQEEPDLVISDVSMPRMNGFEMCLQIRRDEKIAETPVVMITALASEADKRKGIESGADAYITKSTFDQHNLLETIERLIS